MQWHLQHFPRKVWTSIGAIRSARTWRVRHLSYYALDSPSIATLLATPPSRDVSVITAVGSIRTIRNQKKRSFIEIGDGSTVHTLQALVQPSYAEGLGTGTVVAITGQWREAPTDKEQSYELHAEEIQVVGRADAKTYPVQKKAHSAEWLRTIPHLRLRIPIYALLVRLKSECDFRIAEQFRLEGFVRVQPPIITSSDCEGAGEVFLVSENDQVQDNDASSSIHQDRKHFFRDPKFLTVSSQLHLEAFVHEHQKVWTLSPTFRAEKSDTPRHSSEFWMLEAELRTEKVEAVIDVVENMITNLVQSLQNSNFMQELSEVAPREDLCDLDHRQWTDQLQERWNGLRRAPYRRITYSEAIETLEEAVKTKEAVFQYEPVWRKGLHAEHERYIAACVGQGSPVFITDYPAAIKPFYMLPSVTKGHIPATAACFDLLLPNGTEVAGGSMREHRLEKLEQAMRTRGLSVPPSVCQNEGVEPQKMPAKSGGELDWYLDLRRYGSVPHGGFGLGFDRLIGYLAGVNNIRDVVAWPRYYGHCDG